MVTLLKLMKLHNASRQIYYSTSIYQMAPPYNYIRLKVKIILIIDLKWKNILILKSYLIYL